MAQFQQYPRRDNANRNRANPKLAQRRQRAKNNRMALERNNHHNDRFEIEQNNLERNQVEAHNYNGHNDEVRNRMDQILEILEHTHGPAFRRHRPIYRKPYPEWIDREPYPRGSRIPEFSTFSGEDDKIVLEHMSRFTIQ